MKKAGKVFLAGSGPGDEKLITVAAAEALSLADAVIYDNLINERLLDLYCGGQCEKIYVGKSGASHTMEQEDINRLIVDKARQYGIVVRLKGGDPFIFGRGGEEALALRAAGIEYEIICGISSAYAVPAYAGIPVTHRGLSASVAFITGHEDPTKEKSDIHWDKLATGVQTLVFLMGVKNIPLIMTKLMENGRDGATPVAVINNGTYPAQRSVTGTIATIAGIVEREGITPPSIVVVGDVVSLKDRLDWFEKKPLFGRTIIVTRSRAQASVLVEKLAALGAGVIELPSISIAPVEDPSDIIGCINAIEDYDWIVFTSTNGVDHFFNHLRSGGGDFRKLHRNRICAIGPATAGALEKRGITPDLIPEKFESSQVVREMESRGEIRGRSFLLPRADIAPEAMREDLLRRGARKVDDVPVYRTVPVNYSVDSAIADLDPEAVDLVTFTSSSTVRNFRSIVMQKGNDGFLKIPCAAIGPVTATTARDEGFTVAIEAGEYTIDGLVEAVCAYFSVKK